MGEEEVTGLRKFKEEINNFGDSRFQWKRIDRDCWLKKHNLENEVNQERQSFWSIYSHS